MKRQCWICGREYEYCHNCDKTGNWRAQACSPEHYQVVQINREYREGIINAVEATQLYANIGITANSKLNYLPAVEATIKGIIKEGIPKKVSKPKSKIEKSEEDEESSES